MVLVELISRRAHTWAWWSRFLTIPLPSPTRPSSFSWQYLSAKELSEFSRFIPNVLYQRPIYLHSSVGSWYEWVFTPRLNFGQPSADQNKFGSQCFPYRFWRHLCGIRYKVKDNYNTSDIDLHQSCIRCCMATKPVPHQHPWSVHHGLVSARSINCLPTKPYILRLQSPWPWPTGLAGLTSALSQSCNIPTKTGILTPNEYWNNLEILIVVYIEWIIYPQALFCSITECPTLTKMSAISIPSVTKLFLVGHKSIHRSIRPFGRSKTTVQQLGTYSNWQITCLLSLLSLSICATLCIGLWTLLMLFHYLLLWILNRATCPLVLLIGQTNVTMCSYQAYLYPFCSNSIRSSPGYS